MAAKLIALLVLVLGAACSSESTPSTSPPAPPPPPPGAPAPMAIPGASSVANDPVAAMRALSAAAQQLGMAGQAGQGPVINWRELAPFAPDNIAGFKAKGELDGSTTAMQGMQVSQVKRRYELDKDRMHIEVIDTSFAAFMRMPFALAAALQEDSTKGYKKGTTIKAQPAIVEWRSSGHSEAHLLVAQRFVVNVSVDTQTQGLAERVAAALDIAGLEALAARAQVTPGGPVPPPVAPAPPAAPHK